MSTWRVEIASRPGIRSPGLPDEVLTAIGAAVDDAVERGVLVEGSGTGSADGRIGGEWVVEAPSAAQAAVACSERMIATLSFLQIPMAETGVDVLRVEREIDA